MVTSTNIKSHRSFHTALDIYQADLLRDIDQGEGPTVEDITELCKATDLSLRVTCLHW